MVRTRRDSEVVRITSAPQSRKDELAHRQRRYVVSMGIRTVCFIAAVLVPRGWLTWVLIVAAFVLPYIAVVMANSESPSVADTDIVGPGAGQDDGPKELGGGS
jgi:hypothetical protein